MLSKIEKIVRFYQKKYRYLSEDIEATAVLAQLENADVEKSIRKMIRSLTKKERIRSSSIVSSFEDAEFIEFAVKNDLNIPQVMEIIKK